jgi:hypothetical protein
MTANVSPRRLSTRPRLPQANDPVLLVQQPLGTILVGGARRNRQGRDAGKRNEFTETI